jgi:hypothetical protein
MNVSSTRVALAIGAMALFAIPSSAQRACWPQRTLTAGQIVAPGLRYRLIDYFGPVSFCDPDCVGPCNLERERQHAEEAFPQIRKDAEAFEAITQHLKFGRLSEFSDEQKLSIYREYKKVLCAVSLEPEMEKHRFKIATTNGFIVEGRIDPQGKITLLDKKRSVLSCPK